MTALAFADLAAQVQTAFPAVTIRTSGNSQSALLVPAGDLIAVARWLRDTPALAFDSLMDLTGWDLLKFPATPPSTDLVVAYFLHSLAHRHKLTLQVQLPRETAETPSVGEIWLVAIYFEREVWDLLGVRFAGHASLRRIMCPDDWVGHPLRKDYVYPESYRGVAHLREGQHFEDAPNRGAPA